MQIIALEHKHNKQFNIQFYTVLSENKNLIIWGHTAFNDKNNAVLHLGFKYLDDMNYKSSDCFTLYIVVRYGPVYFF